MEIQHLYISLKPQPHAVLYHAHNAINFDENTFFQFHHSLRSLNIVITKFSFSFHCYVHYAVIKTKKALFFLLIIVMILPLRLLRQDLEKLHIFISMLRSLQCDYDKKCSFYVTSTWLLWNSEKSFFFSFCYYFHYAMIKIKRSFFILLLRLSRHDQVRVFLHFSTPFAVRYTMVTRKGNLIILYYYHYLDYAAIMKKIFLFFIFTFTTQIPYRTKQSRTKVTKFLGGE